MLSFIHILLIYLFNEAIIIHIQKKNHTQLDRNLRQYKYSRFLSVREDDTV